MAMTDAETMDHVEPTPVDDTKQKMTPAQEAQREADSRSPAGTEYDTPPKEWAPGTKYDPETDPDDMTDAEYIQWMYDNHTPFWAIKRNMLYRTAPVLTSIEPTSAQIGAESFQLVVSGHGLVQDVSVIVFAGQDEPSTLHANGTLTTGVNMSVWHGPDTVEVRVRNGDKVSEPLQFTFTAAPGATATGVTSSHVVEPLEPAYDEPEDNGKKKKKK
jgi:hypothetical protein